MHFKAQKESLVNIEGPFEKDVIVSKSCQSCILQGVGLQYF